MQMLTPQTAGVGLKRVNLEVKENHMAHHTVGLSSTHLVTRRGQPFKLLLHFHDPGFSRHYETLVFQALLGDLAVEFPVTFLDKVTNVGWRAWISPQEVLPRCVSVPVRVCSPVSAPVGLHELKLIVQNSLGQQCYNAGRFILLCNPWLKADPVYLPDEEQREEYVRNDAGVLYLGTPHNITTRHWAFGQYESEVLEVCLNLLQVSPQHVWDRRRDYLRRSDPVYISRVICAMINCADERSVLKGSWSGDPQASGNGVDAADWTGSAKILKLWDAARFRPVCYGQCWVFASVMCTVMRALGIPCRVVTIFNSAHNTKGNMIVEEYYTDSGKKLDLSQNTVWNFHMWVECWMTRPDLGSEFDGWQVLDPTPQERRTGVFCCGPCSVKAIRMRNVNLLYDTPFIFASVNAGVVTVVMQDGQEVSRRVERKRVGSHIYTKRIGSDRPESLTCNYKCVLDNLSRCGERGHDMSRSLQASLRLDRVHVMGEDVVLTVAVRNTSHSLRTFREHVNAQAKVYNRGAQQTLWETHSRLHIWPGEEVLIEHVIPHSQYESRLTSDCLVNVAAVVVDERTQEHMLVSEEFNFSVPNISIQVTGGDRVVLHKEHSAEVSFTNVFSTTMTDTVLTVEGTSLIQGKHQSRLYLLQPGQVMKTKVTFIPVVLGVKALHAKLTFRNRPALVIRETHKVSVSTPASTEDNKVQYFREKCC
ncbi:hypothetical protein MHYP_G00085300 [Metynnis hypsauchen]